MTLRLIELSSHPLGSVEAIYAGARPGDAWSIEDGAVAYELHPVVELFGRDIGLDLLSARDAAAAPWMLREPDRRIRLSTDLDPALAEEAEVYRLELTRKTRRPVLCVHRDPITGGRTAVTGGRRYRCEVSAATDGLSADLLILIHDAKGAHIDSVRRQLAARGTGASALERVEIDFDAPNDAAAVEITVAVRPGAAGGQLRLGRPALAMRGRGAPKSWSMMRLRRADLEALSAAPAADLARVRMPLPARLLDGERRELVLRLRGEGGHIGAPLSVRRSRSFVLSKRGVERASAVRLAGRTPEAMAAFSLELFVDGERSATAQVAAPKGKFDTRLLVGDAHMDGRPHTLQVREAASQAVIFETHVTVAAFHARWPVLQAYAQAPLSAESSPAVARHRRALAAWAARARAGEAIPPVAWLHGELLAGVVRRPAYPRLAFPGPARPRVSVVVPAHNKFEVTYLCLCALLFAANELSFEVIVVDDGSADETARLEEIVSGVRVVRHETARGFVAACRAGAARARGEFICFLNNDTEVAAGWLDELVGAFDRFERVGLTGAKLIYPDGRLQEAGGVVWGSGDPWNAGRGGDTEDPSWTYAREVDYLSGAAILTPRSVWEELGGFSEEFAPAYFEDTDFAMKVRASGRRVLYVPTAEVYHFEGATSGTDKAEGAKRYQEINRPKFKQKWKSLYAGGREVGDRLDLEKDRMAALRALWFAPAPQPGSEAAEALRALQAAGCKVTLLPPDLRHDPVMDALRRDGVECLHAPWVVDPVAWLSERGADFDFIAPHSRAAAALLAAAGRPLPSPRLKAAAGLAFAERVAAVRAELARFDLYGSDGPGLYPVAAAAQARAVPGGPRPSGPRRRA